MKRKIKITEQDICNMVTETINECLKANSKQEVEKRKSAFRSLHRPARNLNEDVMYRYYIIKRKSNCAPVLLEGITVDRLMKKHGANGFVIVSANRSSMDEEYNTRATQSLINDIKKSGYSYLPTYGGYHSQDGSEEDSYEPSFIIFNYNENGEPGDFTALKIFAIEMCGKYDQDSVFIQAPGEAPNYVNRDGEVCNSSSSKDYIKNDMSQEFFTSLSSPIELAKRDQNGEKIGRRFTSDIIFENIMHHRLLVNPMPEQLSERMRRKGEVMIWN